MPQQCPCCDLTPAPLECSGQVRNCRVCPAVSQAKHGPVSIEEGDAVVAKNLAQGVDLGVIVCAKRRRRI